MFSGYSTPINGTVLGAAPFRSSLLCVALALSLLFTFVKPEASAGLALVARFSFWVLHVGIGLAAIFFASYCLRFWRMSQLPTIVALGLAGVLGAAVAAPFYCLVELFYPPELIEDGLDQFAAQGWWQALVAEFLCAMPIMLMSWYAVNLPYLLHKPILISTPESDEAIDNSEEEQAAEKREQRLMALYQRLPEVIGRDIVAMSSDLHYINVYTTLGKAMILGSLKHYATALGDAGLQVHRANWVAKQHVVKVHVSGDGAYCLMSNGLKVAISRNKRKEVKRYFGQSALHTEVAARPMLSCVK